MQHSREKSKLPNGDRDGETEDQTEISGKHEETEANAETSRRQCEWESALDLSPQCGMCVRLCMDVLLWSCATVELYI